MILRRLDNDKEAEVRVVGQLGCHGESHTYGVAFLDPEMDFWGVQFPSLTEFEEEGSRVLLQCGGCSAREMVQQSDLESDVYLVNDGIVRFCKRCGSSTIWKRAAEGAVSDPVPLENTPPQAEERAKRVETLPAAPPDPPPAPEPAAPTENTPTPVRPRAHFHARILSTHLADPSTR